MKNSFIISISCIMVTLSTLYLTSCSSDKEPAEVAVKLVSVSDKDAIVTFTPNEHTVSWTFARGSADDLAAFEGGSLKGTQKAEGNKPSTPTFGDLQPETTYTIFARGVNADGDRGKTTTVTFTTTEEMEPSLPVNPD